MTIPISRSAMTKVKTLERPRCHPISKKAIWSTGRKSYIQTRRALIRQYTLQGFQCQRKGAVPILSFPTLHFQIYDIQSGPLHHQMATFDAAKQFMEAIILTKIPWPIISDEKYSMLDKVWKLGLDAQDCQRALAGALVGAPSVCQLPSGPSLEIDPLT